MWGGENIYNDTDEKSKMAKDYETLKKQQGYLELLENLAVMANWDDHNCGFNDNGIKFNKKEQAQKFFLDFFNVYESNPLRKQAGIYNAKEFKTKEVSIKVLVLNTRYFRTALIKASKETKKRDVANMDRNDSVLGAAQWNWLENELKTSTADFNIIVSSIQILSSEHGFET